MSNWHEELERRVEGFAPRMDEGAHLRGGVGIVEGLMAMVKHAGGEEEAWSRDELLFMTSVAGKHYVYEEDFNPQYEPPRYFSLLAELFSNYGIFESFEQHVGWEVREFNFLSAGDLAKLLAFEFQEGRAVLSWGLASVPEVVWLVGVAASPSRFEVEYMGADGVVRVLDLRDQGGTLQGEGEENLVNWCVVARPKPPEAREVAWALSEERRRQLVLGWYVKHGRSRKEFFHETRENYATGLAAYDTLARSVTQRHEAMKQGDEEGREAFLEQLEWHVQELREGRRAMARVLESVKDFEHVGQMYEEVVALLGKLEPGGDKDAQAWLRVKAKEEEALKALGEQLEREQR